MWLIAGTVPQADFPLTFGPCTVTDSPAGARLHVDGHSLAVERGTAEACLQAVQASRHLAQVAQPCPATQVGALLRLDFITEVVKKMG